MMMRLLEKLTLSLCFLFLLKLLHTGQLAFLIHPRYFWLIYLSIALVFLILVFDSKEKHLQFNHRILLTSLLFIFLFGSVVSFKPLSSFAQLQKALPAARSLDEFKRGKRLSEFSMNTKERELEDWVTVFSLDPEPTKYASMEVDVSGFYFLDPEGNPMVARYVISCCAADSRIIGLRLSKDLDIQPDTWIRVEGTFSVFENNHLRDLMVRVASFELIPTPENPYVVN